MRPRARTCTQKPNERQMEGCFNPLCLNPKESAKKKCSACKEALYCDEYCQRGHWAEHKKFCKRDASQLEAPPCAAPCCDDGRAISPMLHYCEHHARAKFKGCVLQGCGVPARENSPFCVKHACGNFECPRRFTCCTEHPNKLSRVPGMRLKSNYDFFVQDSKSNVRIETGAGVDMGKTCAVKDCPETALEKELFCSLRHRCVLCLNVQFDPVDLCQDTCNILECRRKREECRDYCYEHDCDVCRGPFPSCGHRCQHVITGLHGYLEEGQQCNEKASSADKKFCIYHKCPQCHGHCDECEHCCSKLGCNHKNLALEFASAGRSVLSVDGAHHLVFRDKLSGLAEFFRLTEFCREHTCHVHGCENETFKFQYEALFCDEHTCSAQRESSSYPEGDPRRRCCAKVEGSTGHCEEHVKIMPEFCADGEEPCACKRCLGIMTKSARKE